MGGRDGRIRAFDNEATSDDNTPIESELFIGPLQDKDQAFVMTDLRMTLGSESAKATWGVRAGQFAQDALNAEDTYTGTIRAGQNPSQALRVRGKSAFVRLSSNEIAAPWSLEQVQAVVELKQGVVASRVN